MSPHDRGFNAGMRYAAQLARQAAEAVLARPHPKTFGEREQRASVAALEGLAEAIDADIGCAPVHSNPVAIVPPASAPVTEAPVIASETAMAGAGAAKDRESAEIARAKGYTGDQCGDCGNFTLVRNGTCLKCETCGGTTGCS